MKETKSSIKINYIMNTLLTVASVLFPLITFPYVSRVLQAEGTGKVNFAMSVVVYFNMFAQLGIPVYGIRACARVRDDKEKLSRVAHELLFIGLVTSFLSSVFLGASVCLIPRLYNEKLLYVIISSMIWLETLGMEWLFKALEQYTYMTVRSLIFKVIGIVAMFMLVRDTGDYAYYALVLMIASYASMILNLFTAGRYIYLKSVGGYDLKRHINSIMVFFAMACATTVYTNLDEVMLGFMTTDVDVGYYHAAVRVKSLLVALITSLGAVLLPRLSWYIEQGLKKEFENMCRKAVNYILLSALPFMAYFIIQAVNVILVLAGRGFMESVSSMRIIMPTLLLIGITNVLGIQVLVPTGREKYVLYSEIAGAFTDLMLNAVLIPSYRADGAAIGTLAAEFVVLFVQLWALRKEVRVFFEGIQYIRIIAALAVSCVVSYIVFRDSSMNAFLQLFFSALVFFGIYLSLLCVLREKLTSELLSGLIGYVKRKRRK